MRKILLTSAGFENRRILKIFQNLLAKDPSAARALFIPTAANDADAVAVLPKCMGDLLDAGIPTKNIAVFDLHRSMTAEDLAQYDAVYFTGGSPRYLLQRINDTGFCKPLTQFVDKGGVYVGVSAGSIVAAGNLPDSLGYIGCTLSVHTETGTKGGPVNISENSHIDLTNHSAILIQGDDCKIVD